jgi:glycerophosphoryl diester phosphodiesterase
VLAVTAPAAAAAPPPIHAHRGGSVLDGIPTHPENTMAAFRNASRSGYVLEMDVKLTSDRVPVVIHDATLDRTTACAGEVAARTLAQVRGCRADVLGSPGNGLPTRAVTPREPIPTLAEALAFAKREGAFVNLEIKNQPTDPDFDPGSGFADTVMAAVKASGLPKGQLIVQSFWPPNLTAAKARLPGVETSLLTLAQANDGGPAFASAAGHQWVSPAWPVTPSYVAGAKARGLKVVPYTLNEAAEFRASRTAGVNALITDDPAFASRVLGLSRRDLAPDALKPVARIRAPRYASDAGRRPRFRIRLAATDRGSGVAGLRLQYRRNTNVATRWRAVVRETLAGSVFFRGKPGQTYLFRLRARDRLGNFSPFVYARTSVPLDDRSPRLDFGRRWARASDRRAWKGTVRRALRPGVAMTMRFRGDQVALIAPRSLAGGRMRVRVAGRSRVVSLRGDAVARRVVFRSRVLRPGVHRLWVRTLGGGPVTVDAVAFRQGPDLPGR